MKTKGILFAVAYTLTTAASHAQMPDLKVISASIVGNNIVATIRNDGSTYTGSRTFFVFFNNQSSGIGYSTPNNLVPPNGFGGTLQVTAPVTNTGLSGCSGNKNFIITVNPNGNVPESNTFNNSFSISLPCQTPPPPPPPPPPSANNCTVSSFSGPDTTTAASQFGITANVASTSCTGGMIFAHNAGTGNGLTLNNFNGSNYVYMVNWPTNWTDNSLNYNIVLWNSATGTMDARSRRATVTDINPSPVQCTISNVGASLNTTNNTISVGWSAPANCGVMIKYWVFNGQGASSITHAPGGNPFFPANGSTTIPAPSSDTVIEIEASYMSSSTSADLVSDTVVIPVKR